MPTLAVTLTSLLTPAYTFRSVHSVNADVKVEFDEAIPTTALLPADQSSGTKQIAVLVDCGLPGIPNAAASNSIVGVCSGGQSPMRMWVLGDPVTSGSLVATNWYAITGFQAGDNFSNVHDQSRSGAAGSDPNGFTGLIFQATGTTPTTWTNSSELRPVLGWIDCGGGPNDTVTDGDGDFVWPTYSGEADPSIRNTGDITMLAVTRESAGVAGQTDNDTNYNQTMDMRTAIFYNAN